MRLFSLYHCALLLTTPVTAQDTPEPPTRQEQQPAEQQPQSLRLSDILPEITAQPTPFDHLTRDYQTQTIHHFTVHVHQDLLPNHIHAQLGKSSLAELTKQIQHINNVIPPTALAHLHNVPIWISPHDNHNRFPAACYHPSKDWLEHNDYNTDKARAVDILNARNFLAWSKDQPAMLLHELAHAYHHRVLSFNNPQIEHAYQQALASHTYEKVQHTNGRTVRHYALNNNQEYFAEATEAYFATNDFHPFNRQQLTQHDPQITQLLEQLWNPPAPEPTTTEPEQPSSP